MKWSQVLRPYVPKQAAGQEKWIMDFRFTIKAKEDWLAANKLLKFLPNANDGIEYTAINVIRELKEK